MWARGGGEVVWARPDTLHCFYSTLCRILPTGMRLRHGASRPVVLSVDLPLEFPFLLILLDYADDGELAYPLLISRIPRIRAGAGFEATRKGVRSLSKIPFLELQIVYPARVVPVSRSFSAVKKPCRNLIRVSRRLFLQAASLPCPSGPSSPWSSILPPGPGPSASFPSGAFTCPPAPPPAAPPPASVLIVLLVF